MKSILIAATMIVAATALASSKKPAPAAAKNERAPAIAQAGSEARILELEDDLNAARTNPKANLDAFREDLQVSANGKEADAEKLPLAPEDAAE